MYNSWLTARADISDIDRWINDAFQDLGKMVKGYADYPRVDVIEYEDSIVLEAELYGLSREDVSVEINENVLSIRGGKRQRDLPKGGKYLAKEIKHSSFERKWTLDPTINQQKVVGKFENGKLTITLPKVAEVKPTKIKVL